MAIAFVGTATASNATGVAVTSAFAATTATGQLIVVSYGDDSATSTTFTSMADNKSNTYLPIGSFQINGMTYRMFYSVLTAGGTGHTVTANWSTVASSRATLVAQYFNGFTGTPTLDQTAGATGASTSANPGTTGATINANELIVIGAVHDAAVSGFSLGTGFTNLGTVSVANAQNGQESNVVSATGTQTGFLTIAASRNWGAQIATFYDSIGGGGSPAAGATMSLMGV